MSYVKLAASGALVAIVVGLLVFPWRATDPNAPAADTAIATEAQSLRMQLARFGHTSLVIGPFVYVLGGVDDTRPTSEVERAPILPDGRLGEFAGVPGARLTRDRAGHASVKIGDWLYVLGGFGGAGFLGSIEQAPIRQNGHLGDFTPVVGTGLVTPRTWPTTAVLGRHLYVIGGHARTGILESVERAAIGPDGGLGPFETVTEPALRTPRTCHTSVVSGNSVFVLGGVDRQGRLVTSVERATLGPGGVLGPFHTLKGVTLQTGRSTPSSLVAGSFLYVLGGSDTTGKMFDSIERARVEADGTLGPFLPLAGRALAIARSSHTNVWVDGTIYVLGGQDDAFHLLTDVEPIRIKPRAAPLL